MADTSLISWTDATFNPWIGCTRISPACDHCYAATWGARFGYEWDAAPVRTSTSNWRKPHVWQRQAEKAGEQRFVFCSSLADVLDKRADPAWRSDLAAMVEATPNLVWLLLSKRPQLAKSEQRGFFDWYDREDGAPRNVWMGTTVENQEEHDRRVPHLRHFPAARRFLSVEPLLGPVKLDLRGIDWVIVGGESGKDARPLHPAWVRSILDQCEEVGVHFHFKQWGEWMPVSEIDNELEETLFDEPRVVEGRRRCRVEQLVMHRDGTVFPMDEWSDIVGGNYTAMAYQQGKGAMQFMRVGTKRSGRTFEGEVYNGRPQPFPVN